MILLGCNIESLLLNRLDASFSFLEQMTNYNSHEVPNPQTKSFDIYTSSKKTQKIPKEILIGQDKFSNLNPNITWFLSGGIKNNFKGAKSEASILKSQIMNIHSLGYKDSILDHANFQFVLDEKSTNTAENFIWASQFLNTTTQTFDDIYIVTSAFHSRRAKHMLKLIDPSRNFKWILGDMEEKDSRYWESIHVLNVESDVRKARVKLEAHGIRD